MNRSSLSLGAACLTLLSAASFAGDFSLPLTPVTAVQDLAQTLAQSRASYSRRLAEDCVYSGKDSLAAEQDLQRIADDLLSNRLDPRRADPASRGETPLHTLAKSSVSRAGDSAAQRLFCDQLGLALLEKGADPNQPDASGWTPIQLAAQHPDKPFREDWQASALYKAMLAAGGDENVASPNGLSAKQILAQEIENRVHPRTLTNEQLCAMDPMSCR